MNKKNFEHTEPTPPTPEDWVDYLIQIGASESPREYAQWVRNTPKPALAQALANQPVATPDTDELIDWAWGAEK